MIRKSGYHARTPLWFYIEKESEVRCGGEKLGPLGSYLGCRYPARIHCVQPAFLLESY